MFAAWPEAARTVKGIAEVEVASIVTCDEAIGVVVPKVEGVVVPETAAASSAKEAAASRWRGERVSKVELSEETSTWRKISWFVLKS